MNKLLLIAVGGALGSVLRYAVQGLGQRLVDGRFPLGTLVVNVLGCFVIGVLGAAFAGPVLVREEYRVGLMVGVLGGFTTFSAFGYETITLLNDGQFGRAAVNVVGTVLFTLGATWAGYRITEKLLGV
jgi:fluoride exporter